jgi:single-strand DNA-binding protein
MPNANSVTLMGLVVRDPELKHIGANNTPLCEISIAVNRVYKDSDGSKKEKTIFVEVKFWARKAEIAAQYLHKGDPVFVQGRLDMDEWDDKQTGQKRSKLKVVADDLQLLTGKPKSEPVPSAGVVDQRSRQPVATVQKNEFGEPDNIPFRTTIYKDVRINRLNRNVF